MLLLVLIPYINHLVLCRAKFAVCCEIRTRPVNALCGQNAQFLDVKTGGTYFNSCALKGP